MATTKPINELKVNFLGKVFFASIASWLVGRQTNLLIRGTRDEVDAVANAMMASRRFQQELNRPGATVDSVMEELGLYHATQREFERILGVEWPLSFILLIGIGHVIINFLSTVSSAGLA